MDHNGEFDPDIDKLAGEMAESEGGVYQLKDLQCGDYFLHEKEAPASVSYTHLGGIRHHKREASGVWAGCRIRRLTPRECLRLQGWTDDRIDLVLPLQSDAQLYKQAGNGVTVNVVEAIGKRLAAAHREVTTIG